MQRTLNLPALGQVADARRALAAESGAAAIDALRAAFNQALKAHPDLLHVTDYCFAGQKVRLRIVSHALADHIRQAFAHLYDPMQSTESPQLTIELWDEAETQNPCPPELAVDLHEKKLVASPDARFIGYRRPESLTWFDRIEGYMIGWRACGQELWTGERSKPLTYLLPVWYQDRDILMVHAGVVAKNGAGVIIGGPSGSGKTTTTLACLLAGFGFLGDDHIGMQVSEDGRFIAHSFYAGARVAPKHLIRFPQLAPRAIESNDPQEDKFLIQISQVFPSQLQRTAAIRAILLPRIGDVQGTSIHRASKAEALLRLAPTSLVREFGPGPRGFEWLSHLVNRVPAYWLELGSDVAQIPRVVEQLFAEEYAA